MLRTQFVSPVYPDCELSLRLPNVCYTAGQSTVWQTQNNAGTICTEHFALYDDLVCHCSAVQRKDGDDASDPYFYRLMWYVTVFTRPMRSSHHEPFRERNLSRTQPQSQA